MNPLARLWHWFHGEIEDPAPAIRSDKLLVCIGVAMAFMVFVHLELEVWKAPLVRGLWRGGAFFGGSVAAVVVWRLWEGRPRDPVAWGIAVLGVAAVLLPTAVRLHPELSLKDDAAQWLVPSWVGIGGLLFAGRRAGLSWADWGLSLGDWRWWLPRAAAVGALIIGGTFAAMVAFDDLREFYPWQRVAREDPMMFAQVQAAVFLDFVGWEYMHRGLLLFALARRGDVRLAIWTQALVFFVLHSGKPEVELLLSLPGGVIAGYFAWRARSFVPLWLLHGLQVATTNQVATIMRGGFPPG